MKIPGRVSAGKSLPEMNRVERKAKTEAEEAKTLKAKSATEPTPSETTNSPAQGSLTQNISGFWILSTAGFLVSLAGLYYKRKEALAATSSCNSTNDNTQATKIGCSARTKTKIYHPRAKKTSVGGSLNILYGLAWQ